MNRYLGILAGLAGLFVLGGAIAQTATLLPNATQTFTDNNGLPLANGNVYFYQPGTTTPQTTWTNSAATVAQPNPVPLGTAGRPASPIYGTGSYRQIVQDQFGNPIWDYVTASTGGSSGGGSSGVTAGDGNAVGTVLLWTGTTLPTNYLYTAGQAVSRTTYPALLTAITYSQTALCQAGIASITVPTATSDGTPIGAAVEASCFAPGTTVIAKSSGQLTMSSNATATTSTTLVVFPWGNGDGATTFNIPDYRGRVPPGRDNMNSSIAGVLTSTYYGVNPDALGAKGGMQSVALGTSNLPPYTPAGTNGTSTTQQSTISGSSSGSATSGGSQTVIVGSPAFGQLTVNAQTFTGTPQGGTSVAFATIQPSVTSDYIIKVQANSIIPYVYGFNVLAPSTLATTGALPNSPTYANGTAGVGATLTAGSNSTLTVDSTAAPLGTVVLVANQAATFQNGIYTVTTAGSGSAPWTLTRASYFNTTANMLAGSYTFVTSGATQAQTGWVLQAAPTTIGTSAVNFVLFSSVQLSNISYTAPYTGAVAETQTNYNAQRVSILDFGAVADTTTGHATANYNAFANALATGKVVFVPYNSAGYNIGANTITMTSLQQIQCENKSTVIYGSATNLVSITSNAGAAPTTILNCEFYGTSPGSTAVFLNTTAANVTGVWLDGISCLFMTHCFDDANSATYGVSFLHAKNIYTTETYGVQFRLRYTGTSGNEGNNDIGGLDCDFTNIPSGTITWQCGVFLGIQGLKISDQLIATSTITNSPTFVSSIPTWQFNGVASGAALIINADIYAEGNSGDGISIDSLYVNGSGNLYMVANLGAQAILTGGSQANFGTMLLYGPQGVAGVTPEASTDVLQINSQTKTNIVNVLATGATGGAINYSGASSYVNISNLIAYGNQGYILDMPSGGGNSEDYLNIFAGQWDGAGTGGINNAISATHLCYLNIRGIASSCFGDGLIIKGSNTINGTFQTLGNVDFGTGIGTGGGAYFICYNTTGNGPVTYSATPCNSFYAASTWTPAVTASSTAGTPAYSVQVGSYEQIGRQITVRFTITLSGWTGSPSGNISITGLPVASASATNDNGVCHLSNYTVSGLASLSYGMTGEIAPNTSVINLYQNSNSGTVAVTAAQAGTTPTLVGMCSYHN